MVLYLKRFPDFRRRVAWCWLTASLFACTTLVRAQPGGEDFPPPPELSPLPAFHISVEDTNCRILIAQVHLQIGNLTLSGDQQPALTGNYSIDVPIRKSKSETGSMTLPLEHPLEVYLAEGGVLRGRGISFKDPAAKRQITCEILPDPREIREGTIHLSIDTGKRVMEFESSYTVEGEIPEAVETGESAVANLGNESAATAEGPESASAG